MIHTYEMSQLNDYEPYITQETIDKGHARRMNILEDYFAMLQRQDIYRNFNLYAELSQPITKNQLTAALTSVFRKYPILACTVIPKNFPDYESFYLSNNYLSTPYPERDYIKVCDKIFLSDILLNEQPEHKDIVDKIIAQFIEDDYTYTGAVIELVGSISFPRFDGETPNWRLILLPSPINDADSTSKLIYVTNHILSDGMSSINLFEDIVAHLSGDKLSCTKSDEGGVIFDYAKESEDIRKLPAPITEYVDYKATLGDIPKLLISAFIKDHLDYKSDGDKTTRMSSEGIQTYHELVNFTLSEITAFKAIIKKNVHRQCTLTPFFQTCFLVALHRYSNIFNGSWTQWGFDVCQTKNTRDFLPDDAELRDAFRYGSNIAGFHYSYLISAFDVKFNETGKFWRLVEYYHDVYQNHRGALIGFGSLMLDQVCQKQNIDDLITKEYLNKKRAGLMMSNVGFHKQDMFAPYYIKDAVFSQTPGAMKFTFGMNLISTSEGGANIDMSVIRSAFPGRNAWINFCAEYVRVVRNFCNYETLLYNVTEKVN